MTRELTAEEAQEFDTLEAELQETSKDLRKAEGDRERNWRWEQMQEVAERRASLSQASEVLKDRIRPDADRRISQGIRPLDALWP